LIVHEIVIVVHVGWAKARLRAVPTILLAAADMVGTSPDADESGDFAHPTAELGEIQDRESSGGCGVYHRATCGLIAGYETAARRAITIVFISIVGLR
jgi:hypothetical protein